MKNLMAPSEYTLANPRIDGWKKLREVNARAVDVFVFPLEIFEYFKKTGKLHKDFVVEVKRVSAKIIADSPSRSALVRRAFVVPGLENPPGPRFLGLTTPEKVIDAICELFKFAIDQKYPDVPGSQISGWIEPPSTVLDLDEFKKNPESVAIPYGGYAVASDGTVEIFSVFGINEGVQSLVADRYLVEFRRNRPFVLKKEVPQKNLMLCTTRTEGKKMLSVPVDLQFDQVLSDIEVLEVARVVHELAEKYGPQRVEFSTDEKGICFNEVADFWKEGDSVKEQNINVRGKVKEIANLQDFKTLVSLPKDDLQSGKVIVKISEDIISGRDYDVLGAIAAWRDRFYVLYPGVAATQHAMRILTDKGHKAFLIGNQKFDNDDEVQIIVTGGKVRVTNLTNVQSQYVASLWDASLLGVELCGGKADRLSKMKISGYQVPHGLVLTTKLYEDREAQKNIRSLVSDYIKSEKKFAVRSSANLEDSSTDSMAGMFDTFLNVPGNELVEKIELVLKSTKAPKVLKHLAKDADKIGRLKMAVVVQQMVEARCAGVIFGAKAQTGNTDIVEIEANLGLGEGIVSGQSQEVEQFKFSRTERRVLERKGPSILTQPEVKALFMLSDRLRNDFGDVPQDVEWTIDQGGQIWVLQSRDLYLGV